MTNEEAINCINVILNSPYRNDKCFGHLITSDDFEWLEKAKEALEKQIPKKPTEKIHSRSNEGYYVCPSCNSNEMVIGYSAYRKAHNRDNYCDRCGQALDWSDEK